VHPRERALAALLPEAKAAVVAGLDAEDTLYFGDGINDALAFEAAYAAGTPAIDRPVMPGKSDFFTVGEGLAPLAEALAAARRLRRVVALSPRVRDRLQRRRRPALPRRPDVAAPRRRPDAGQHAVPALAHGLDALRSRRSAAVRRPPAPVPSIAAEAAP
jgi:hypothetical protein